MHQVLEKHQDLEDKVRTKTCRVKYNLLILSFPRTQKLISESLLLISSRLQYRSVYALNLITAWTYLHSVRVIEISKDKAWTQFYRKPFVKKYSQNSCSDEPYLTGHGYCRCIKNGQERFGFGLGPDYKLWLLNLSQKWRSWWSAEAKNYCT